MEIKDILSLPAEEAIQELQKKVTSVPAWADLVKQYDPTQHEVMNTSEYQDIVVDGGKVERVSRVTYDMQRLATKRMAGMMFGIPVKRVYKTNESEVQKEYAGYLEKIFKKVHVDSMNLARGKKLFASCECATIWYTVKQPNNSYGFNSQVKVRCRTFSPMDGDALYPYFDEYGDLTAFSVLTKSKEADSKTQYFDTYTADKHIRWVDEGDGWEQTIVENTTMGKIPAVYISRQTPIWENLSDNVKELEWAMSRDGNYLRKNSKPLFAVFSEEVIEYNKEKNENEESRGILQFPSGANAQYITWNQPTENLQFFMDEIRRQFYTSLQIPDFSYENMKSTPMSGESRKQLFTDAHLKVVDESGMWIEFFDREVSVVKSIFAQIFPNCNREELDALVVENEIVPFTIGNDKESIADLMRANGNKPLMSQQESIEFLGWSDDATKTIELLKQEAEAEMALEKLADAGL